MNTDILITHQRHLGIITLNRPHALNALTYSMVMTLQQQLTDWQDDSTIHAVVIRSAEGKAFCAGGDVRWLYEAESDAQQRFFKEEYRLNRLIYHYKKPYIALMDGITMGGGVGISLHGSHPVASPAFMFAMPETSIGFFPDIGASHFLSRLPQSIGIYLGLTGNRLNAQEAHALDLVTHVIPSSQFDALLAELSHMDLSLEANHQVKKCLDQYSQPIDIEAIRSLKTAVDEHFSYPSVSEILDSLDRAKTDWPHELANLLKQKSPISLCVTLAQLLKAQKMSFDACIQMDTHLVKHFMNDHDFYEGVRALLIDKDKSPKWQPATLLLVDPNTVSAYFE